MSSRLYRSGTRITSGDLQELTEFINSPVRTEAKLHRLLERHPALLGSLGFIEFLSEYSLVKRDEQNRIIEDRRKHNRSDLVAATLDISASYNAKRFAHVVELKRPDLHLHRPGGQRLHPDLTKAIEQVKDYAASLTESENKEGLAKFGWEVWKPSVTLIMGSAASLQAPGLLRAIRQRVLQEYGVQLYTIEEFLRFALESSYLQATYVEGVVGLGPSDAACLLVASGQLGGLLLAQSRVRDAQNTYGDVDIREGVPDGLVHIDELRVQPLCRKLDIPFAGALIGFREYGRRRWSPERMGVVVADYDEQVLRQALAERDERNAPRRERQQRKQDEARRRKVERRRRVVKEFREAIISMFPLLEPSEAAHIARHATSPGSGRVGTHRELHLRERVWLAVAAHVAYGSLECRSRESAYYARFQVRKQLLDWGGPPPDEVLRPQLRFKEP